MTLVIFWLLLRYVIVAWLAIFDAFFYVASGHFDYHDALKKSLILLEAQRSAELPSNNIISRRTDSALQDGALSWAAKFYAAELEAAGEMENVRCAILWDTGYYLKAADREKLFVQVLAEVSKSLFPSLLLSRLVSM